VIRRVCLLADWCVCSLVHIRPPAAMAGGWECGRHCACLAVTVFQDLQRDKILGFPCFQGL